jgi:glutamyl-tRNA synthetase
MLPYLQQAGLLTTSASVEDLDKLGRIITAAGDRLKVSGDILAYADFFFRDDFVYDEAAFDKQVRKPGAIELLAKFRAELAAATAFDVAALETLMHEFLTAEGIKIGDLIHTLRVAVTGKPVGPGLYDCLAILGQPTCLARIDRTIARADG